MNSSPSDQHNRPKRPRHRKPENWRPLYNGGRCGAWSRRRKAACRAWPVRGERRCAKHGGIKGELSSEGRKAISEASKREWAKHRAALGLPPDWRYGSTWVSRRQRETAAMWVAKHKGKPEDDGS